MFQDVNRLCRFPNKSGRQLRTRQSCFRVEIKSRLPGLSWEARSLLWVSKCVTKQDFLEWNYRILWIYELRCTTCAESQLQPWCDFESSLKNGHFSKAIMRKKHHCQGRKTKFSLPKKAQDLVESHSSWNMQSFYANKIISVNWTSFFEFDLRVEGVWWTHLAASLVKYDFYIQNRTKLLKKKKGV